MKSAIKITVIVMVAAVSFAGYALVFGMMMGAGPKAIMAALNIFGEPVELNKDGSPQDPLNPDQAIAVSDSVSADSLPVEPVQATAPHSDTLQEQLTQISHEKAELEKLRNEIKGLLSIKSKSDSLRLAGLAKMYDGVEPSQLAAVIANMDDSLVIAILPRLKTQKAGKVLETMPAERAARISSKILGVF